MNSKLEWELRHPNYKSEYMKQYRKDHPELTKKNNEKSNKKWSKINNKKYLKFKDKRIFLRESPRIGVCNLCRAVAGIDCELTSMHHINYHDNDPTKDTIELCNPCHTTIHNKERKKK